MQSNPRLPYTLRWLSVLFVTCMVMDQARGQSQLPGPQAAPQVPLAPPPSDIEDDWATSDFAGLGRIPDFDDQPTVPKIHLPPNMEGAEPILQSEVSPEMTGWIRWLVLRNLPETYEDKRKWGKQKEVWDGLDIERQGLRIETHRKYKKVDHGTWSRYFVELIDPANELQIRIYDLKEVRPGVLFFRTSVEAPIKVYGQVRRYQWDVRTFSISAQANARSRMTTETELSIQLNPVLLPPSVTLTPKILDAKVELLEFQVTRISHVKGSVAKVLGSSLREVLDRKLAEYDDKLVEKMNKQLDKQKDHFHVSADKWLGSSLKTKVDPIPMPIPASMP